MNGQIYVNLIRRLIEDTPVERYPLFNIHEHHGQVVSSILLKNRRSLAERSVAGKDADTEPHLG